MRAVTSESSRGFRGGGGGGGGGEGDITNRPLTFLQHFQIYPKLVLLCRGCKSWFHRLIEIQY